MSMSESDKQGFFADQANLDMDDYLIFEYYFESIADPEEAAAHLCQEQSTAQWKRVDVDEDLRDRFGAKVIELEVAKEMETPSFCLPPDIGKRTFVCHVKIAHPHGNFGPKLPNILTAAAGEGAFYSPGIPVIKLLDIGFPDSFLQAFEGPRFGIKGLRDILGVHDRPLFFWSHQTQYRPCARALCRTCLPELVGRRGHRQRRRDAVRRRMVALEQASQVIGRCTQKK